MTLGETLSIAASCVSILLAVFAIWLAIVFYKESTHSTGEIRNLAEAIGKTVTGVHIIAETVHTDTFRLMEKTVMATLANDDAVTKETNARARAKLEQLEYLVQTQMTQLLANRGSNDAQLSDGVNTVIKRAVVESQTIHTNAREETVRDHIVSALTELRHRAVVATLGSVLAHLSPSLSEREVVQELRRMRAGGYLTWPGSIDRLRWSDELTLVAQSPGNI